MSASVCHFSLTARLLSEGVEQTAESIRFFDSGVHGIHIPERIQAFYHCILRSAKIVSILNINLAIIFTSLSEASSSNVSR